MLLHPDLYIVAAVAAAAAAAAVVAATAAAAAAAAAPGDKQQQSSTHCLCLRLHKGEVLRTVCCSTASEETLKEQCSRRQ